MRSNLTDHLQTSFNIQPAKMGLTGPITTTSAAKLHLSPTLEINEIVHQVSAAGKEVTHLGFGEATFPVQKDMLQCHRDSCSSTSYMPVAGLQELREVCPSARV